MSKSSNKARLNQLRVWFSSEFKKGKGKQTAKKWRAKNLK
jgi:hypothetical protein